MKFLWTTIHVENLEESINFYTDLLGLKLLKRFLAGPGMEIAFLGNETEGETLIEFIKSSSHGKVQHSESISIGFAVKSVETMLTIVNDKNIPIHSGPFETPTTRFFLIKDPNGLNIQFFEQNFK